MNSKPISALIYDCEILKCIPLSNSLNDANFEYCEGWHDHANMGISVIGCYDYIEDAYRVFLADNWKEFQRLVENRQHTIGFNSISFDDNLCGANKIYVTTDYDLLCEVRIASGQPPLWEKGKTRPGYALNDLAYANLGMSKSGSGAIAPQLWQQGHYGSVIDYCLRDVALTKKLFDMRKEIKDPTNGEKLTLRDL